ncbi:SlyX family protein [Paralcaligenes ureilyticus]|uniref:SlyX protein n=1 Tax=Paralcaligenes ureilyticus TaxID=627131 RepID=A0A4R3MAR5_9BURK|nr:SlyX family protein [Paralcaligenes ureilyticus]TCT08947.1 SlyX protein [Paralcaligenes ureilyticus]
MSIEDRLIEIEVKLTRQEDLTQELSQLVYRQQKRLDELQAFCVSLAKRSAEASDEGSDRPYGNEKPPHY